MRRSAPFIAVLAVCAMAMTSCARPVNAKSASARWEAGPSASAAPSATDAAPAPVPSASAGRGAPRPGRSTAPVPSSSPAPGQSTTPRSGLDAGGPAGSMRNTGSDGVALTFDDGPDTVQHARRCSTCSRSRSVKATFCVVGFRARDHPEPWSGGSSTRGTPSATTRGSTWRSCPTATTDTCSGICDSTNEAILTAAPNAKIEYFRAPYGNFTPRLNRLRRAAQPEADLLGRRRRVLHDGQVRHGRRDDQPHDGDRAA